MLNNMLTTPTNEPKLLPPDFIPLDEDIAWILGVPCYAAAPIARALRITGQRIAHKAEDEQAAVLHFLLNCWYAYGKRRWREEAKRIVGVILDQHVKEFQLAEGGL